jgi:hypothetical protein
MRGTKRQIEIMALLMKAASTGEWLDIEQLIDQLSSVGTLQSVQCSIRHLHKGAMLERLYATRRGQRRAILVPTPLGFAEFSKKLPL